MHGIVRSGSLFVVVVSLGACLPPLDSTTVDSWRGDEIHFIARGEFEGDPVDITIDGLSDDDTSRVRCVRGYYVPRIDGSVDRKNGTLRQLEIDVNRNLGGEGDELGRTVVQLIQSDFMDANLSDGFDIVPRGELDVPEEQELWLDVDRYDAADQLLAESSAQQGEVVIELLSGMPSDDGLTVPPGEGRVGGHISAEWGPRDQVTVSFTAICTENFVDEEA